MDCSAESLGAHWDGEIANEENIGTKHIQTHTDSNIYEMAKMQ